MKEATQTPYNKCIFRETFSSETETRKQASSVTDVTFENGIGSFNGTTSRIELTNLLRYFEGDFAIRLRFRVNAISDQVILYFSDATKQKTGFSIRPDQGIFGWTFNGAIGPVHNINILEVGKWYDCVFVRIGSTNFGYVNGVTNVGSGTPWTSTRDLNKCYISSRGDSALPFDGDIDLFEIYQGNLTDSEVKNLYDNVWHKELISSNLLLDYDSTNGYITDRTGKNTLTATDVSIKKTGSFYGADFNGNTSKIGCGSDFIGTNAVTVCGWFKFKNYSTASTGRLITNGKYLIRLAKSAADYLVLSSDGGSTQHYVTNQIKLGVWYFIGVTRSSDGLGSFYIGTNSTAPTLNGFANQNTGTPISGTTNVFLGNSSSSSGLDGLIPMLKVYDGILDLEQLTQIWSSTRGRVN